MNTFYKWLEAKEYGEDGRIYDEYGNSCKPTKQMLIGYMLEFLSERCTTNSVRYYFPRNSFSSKGLNMNNCYNWLESQIKSFN